MRVRLDDLEMHALRLRVAQALHGALVQFLKDVAWGELDVLLLDLPPGTGDIALTLSQKLRSSGAVIVTTPQEVALQDVYKSVSMAEKVGIPVQAVGGLTIEEAINMPKRGAPLVVIGAPLAIDANSFNVASGDLKGLLQEITRRIRA